MAFLKNSRFYILCFSGLLSGLLFLWAKFFVTEGYSQTIKLTQLFAFSSIIFLYITLMITPVTRYFTFLPFRGELVKARRAIGVSAFYFGVLHACLAFFGQLGGFAGLFFLSSKYLLAISFSFTALVILTLMALTAFDFMIDKLSFVKWKILHRLIYLAALFILIHALMLGTHFQDLSEMIPQISFGLISLLLILEAKRFDEYLEKRFKLDYKFGASVVLVFGLIAIGSFLYLFPMGSNSLSFGIHSQHIQLAKQAQSGGQNQASNIPGLNGDTTRRFTVSFNPPKQIEASVETKLNFAVYDAASGNKVLVFQKVYEKIAHLVVVDNELSYYNHIHPEQTIDGFDISTAFPHDGEYHLYLNFQPLGAIEQQFAFTVLVGDGKVATATQKPDTNLTKTFGDVKVVLDFPKPLLASDLSIGNQQLTFTLSDNKTGQPITNLKPYLGAFGHLVMIDTKSYDYLHVHPVNLVPQNSLSNGGPEVQFLPLGLYGPIKPGIYRVFAQFNPNDKLFTADFTVEVK